MAQTAVSRVLGLPELLSLIIAFVCELEGTGAESDADEHPSNACVAPLARVAKKWMDPAVSKRWENMITLEPLHSLRRHRQDYYASKIRTLSLENIMELNDCVPDLSCHFPRLEYVELGTLPTWIEYAGEIPLHHPAAVSKLLGPQTRSLGLRAAPVAFDPDLVDAITKTCPRIEKLSVSLGKEPYLPEHLVPLIRALKSSLKRFECLALSLSRSGNLDMLLHALSKVENLEVLQLMQVLSFDLFALWALGHAMKGSAPPGFTSLKKYIAYARLKYLPLLPHIMPPSLETMLIIVDAVPLPGTIPLPSLDSLPLRLHQNMTNLSFTIPGNGDDDDDDVWVFDRHIWLSLASYPNLNTLRVTFTLEEHFEKGGQELGTIGLTDDVFTTLCKAWPLMEDLRLDVTHSMTADSLVALGTHCRNLKRVQIPGFFHFITLFDRPVDPPLFPELRILLTGMMGFGLSAALSSGRSPPGRYGLLSRAVAISKDHLPQQPEFIFVDDEKSAEALNWALEDAWDRDELAMATSDDGDEDGEWEDVESE